MATIVLLHVEIDDAKPLGPQVHLARAKGVPWKCIERATGLSREQLRRYVYHRPHKTVPSRAAGACAS